MIVNYEFLDKEPIENLITCMNFKIDKAVFFGYPEVIEEQRDVTKRILKADCGVREVEFVPLKEHDLQSMIRTMREEIKAELAKKSRIYFDITGGESLVLVAFGMLSLEFDTPMHMYDIPGNRLIELDDTGIATAAEPIPARAVQQSDARDEVSSAAVSSAGVLHAEASNGSASHAGAERCISKTVGKQEVKMTVDLMVRMHGGKINENMQKESKNTADRELIEDAEKIYRISLQHADRWNDFAAFMHNVMVPNMGLNVSLSAADLNKSLNERKVSRTAFNKYIDIINKLEKVGVLKNVGNEGGFYCLTYKNKEVKGCLWEGGSALELHTYHQEKAKGCECRVGVHVDWDGVIHAQNSKDVVNEIDVISIQGVVPTFISCKSGKMKTMVLTALYELDTVAKKLGGKYAKKVLATMQPLGEADGNRAKELGIEVRQG